MVFVLTVWEVVKNRNQNKINNLHRCESHDNFGKPQCLAYCFIAQKNRPHFAFLRQAGPANFVDVELHRAAFVLHSWYNHYVNTNNNNQKMHKHTMQMANVGLFHWSIVDKAVNILTYNYSRPYQYGNKFYFFSHLCSKDIRLIFFPTNRILFKKIVYKI